jgi:polyferredoxin
MSLTERFCAALCPIVAFDERFVPRAPARRAASRIDAAPPIKTLKHRRRCSACDLSGSAVMSPFAQIGVARRPREG